MAYSIARLKDLAHDHDFVRRVRTLARVLIVADPVHTDHLLPLRSYGPAHPGALLRLDPRRPLDLDTLQPQTLADLLEVQDRLLNAEG